MDQTKKGESVRNLTDEELGGRIRSLQEMAAVLSVLITSAESNARTLKRRLDGYDRELDYLLGLRKPVA